MKLRFYVGHSKDVFLCVMISQLPLFRESLTIFLFCRSSEFDAAPSVFLTGYVLIKVAVNAMNAINYFVRVHDRDLIVD